MACQGVLFGLLPCLSILHKITLQFNKISLPLLVIFFTFVACEPTHNKVSYPLPKKWLDTLAVEYSETSLVLFYPFCIRKEYMVLHRKKTHFMAALLSGSVHEQMISQYNCH